MRSLTQFLLKKATEAKRKYVEKTKNSAKNSAKNTYNKILRNKKKVAAALVIMCLLGPPGQIAAGIITAGIVGAAAISHKEKIKQKVQASKNEYKEFKTQRKETTETTKSKTKNINLDPMTNTPSGLEKAKEQMRKLDKEMQSNPNIINLNQMTNTHSGLEKAKEQMRKLAKEMQSNPKIQKVSKKPKLRPKQPSL